MEKKPSKTQKNINTSEKEDSLLPSFESSLKWDNNPDGTIESEIFSLANTSKKASLTKYVKVSIFDIESRGTIKRDKKKVSELISSSFTNITKEEDRGMGSMMGMVIGDAMGHRFEFQDLIYDTIVLKNMGEGKGGHFELEPGQWTDDSSMGLCLADSLLVKKGEFDPRDLMHRFLLWWICSYNNAFRLNKEIRSSCGLSGNISLSFRTYVKEKGKNVYTTAGNKNTSGNGSVMRNASVPICYFKDIDKTRDISKK